MLTRSPSRLAFTALSIGALGISGWLLLRQRAADRPQASSASQPTTMRVEIPVRNLGASFDRTAVLAESPVAPIRFDRMQPGYRRNVNRAPRLSIIATPPSRLRFRQRLPSGAVLRFGVGVEGRGSPGANARGVRFSVHAGGREIFARTVNPATVPRDRDWIDTRVDLGISAERDVEIILATEAVGPPGPLAGIPGWSQVRIVRETQQARQLARADAPNVLILLVDTLRADRLGCYGAAKTPSPTLDRLARDGLRFDEAISQSSWTLPSVASIFTGLFPTSHGVIGEEQRRPGAGRDVAPPDPSYLAESISTLASRAQRAGITTVGVSANHLVSRGTNLATGFETFMEFTWQGGDAVVWASAEDVNGTFLEWLDVNRQHRFLGYLHYMDIHAPYQPPEKYRPVPGPDIRAPVRRGDLGKITVMTRGAGNAALTARELDYLRALYDAQIRYWDTALGDLLAGLSAAGIADHTVVVVTSDHGEAFLEHGRLNHGIQLYDELIRVPLVMSGLPTAKPSTLPLQAQGIDLYPTLAAVLGLEVPPDLPGRNLLAVHDERPAVSELRGLVALRTPDWKLIRDRAENRFELYDLTTDPAERNDVFGQHPTGTALVRQLGNWEASIPPPPPAAGRDPEFREKLRALGYID